ncbi:MAG: protein kinase [Chloroflexi bacterium]|nr:protein kinase [Chloroflexota bacterium]
MNTDAQRIIGGRYEILDAIGQGGMGAVFRGRDTQTGETVAIKSLRPDIVKDDPKLVERFTREGEALRQLNHPSIVKMLAAIEEDNQHYIVMEYVGGKSLKDVLAESGPMPIDRVLHISLDLCDALTRAHRLKIIHRDLKPANVLLASDGTPRLADFGVARLSDKQGHTQTGEVLGTYAYLSPEACHGERLDARTDIWSLGIMLFEMLTGKRPFEEEQLGATLVAIMTKPTPDLAKLRPDAPAGLVHLINEMLVKDPTQRISSVRLVGAELESIIDNIDSGVRHNIAALRVDGPASRFHTPTPGSTMTPLDDSGFPPIKIVMPESKLITPAAATQFAGATTIVTRPPQPRKKWPMIAGFVTLLAVVAALVGFILLGGKNQKDTEASGDSGNADTPNEIVVLDPVPDGDVMVIVGQVEKVEGEERPVLRFILDDLTQTLEVGQPLAKVHIREYPYVIHSDAEAQAIAEANKARVIIWGNYDADVVELEVQIGTVDETLFPRETFEEMSNVRVHLTNPRQESVAPQVLGILANYYNLIGESFNYVVPMVILDDLTVTPAQIVGSTVGAYVQQFYGTYFSDPAQSIEAINKAIALNSRNGVLYQLRALAYQRLGDSENVISNAETAERLGPATWTGPNFLLAMQAFIRNDFRKTIDYQDKVLEVNPNDWLALTFRGLSYYMQGKYDKASADYQMALAAQPETNFPYVVSALIALRTGDLTAASEQIQTVMQLFPDPQFWNRASFGIMGETSGTVTSFYSLTLAAFSEMTLGQYDEALQDIEQALTIRDDLPDTYLFQGIAYCSKGEYEKAREAYTKGIALDPDFTILYLLRAEVYTRDGNVGFAVQDYSTAHGTTAWPQFEAYLAEHPEMTTVGCESFFSQ